MLKCPFIFEEKTSRYGIKPDPCMLHNLLYPKRKRKAFMSFLGTINYPSKFSPAMTTAILQTRNVPPLPLCMRSKCNYQPHRKQKAKEIDGMTLSINVINATIDILSSISFHDIQEVTRRDLHLQKLQLHINEDWLLNWNQTSREIRPYR